MSVFRDLFAELGWAAMEAIDARARDIERSAMLRDLEDTRRSLAMAPRQPESTAEWSSALTAMTSGTVVISVAENRALRMLQARGTCATCGGVLGDAFSGPWQAAAPWFNSGLAREVRAMVDMHACRVEADAEPYHRKLRRMLYGS